MSDVENIENKKTVQFTARVKEDDKTFVVDFIKKFPTQHEGFAELVKSVKGESIETIKEVEKAKPVNACIIEFSPEFIDKLTKIRRYLKSKGKIPADTTQDQFIQKLIDTYVKDTYDFINR